MPFHLTARRGVRAAVGVLWLIAGALQLQPFMFTRGFAQDVLGSAALSQPAPLGGIIRSAEHIVVAHPAPWNWMFALAELLIGLGLVLGRDGPTARIAGWGSVLFGLGVWCVGEGLGGLFTGTAALSTGAPGAALLYSALTMAAWPSPTKDGERPLPYRGLRGLWLAVWLLGAVLVLVPGQWGARGLSAQAAMGWMMSPHRTVAPTLAVTKWLAVLTPFAAALVCASMFIGHAVIGLAVRQSPDVERRFVICGAILALVYWLFGQGFGGLSTGIATDVGSGPLLVVLAGAVLAAQGRASIPVPETRPEVVAGRP